MREERYHLPEIQTLWVLWCLWRLTLASSLLFRPYSHSQVSCLAVLQGLVWFCQPGAHLCGYSLGVVLGPRPWSFTLLWLSVASGYSHVGLSPLVWVFLRSETGVQICYICALTTVTKSLSH